MAGKLDEYTKKRRFEKTGEPHGAVSPQTAGPLRFVVQHHLASRDHYDFRLEWDGVLKSWAVPKGPSYSTRDKRLAVQVEDHPLAYRGFEGVIPQGQYGGGAVQVWDEGTWQPLGDATAGLAQGSLKFTLDGSRLKGGWALVRMKPRPGEKDRNWLLIKEKDAYENAFDVSRFTTSIQTGRTLAEIAAEGGEKEDGMKKQAKPEPKKTPAGGQPRGEKSAAAGAIPAAITHPDKVLFERAGITKGDIAEYYLAVSGRMLPHLQNRILSVLRCPRGAESACFYKKHPGGTKGVAVVSVPTSGGGSEEYYYVTDVYGLLAEVQMNTLEFHTWGSRVEALERPDTMVFDLDPDEGLGLDTIRRGVKDLKNILDQLSLSAYLKTSGGKGYHVVVPFRPAPGWDSFHAFAQNVAKSMEATWPHRYTADMRKDRRKGKIFIDWMRNTRGATTVAPYSVRAREGAPVSMPITWRELDAVAPDGVGTAEAVARLRRKDPWAGFFDTDQQLK